MPLATDPVVGADVTAPEAIDEERAMKFLDGLLSDSQLQSIVDYLSNVPVPQAPAATSNLYDLYCASCHGAGGVGGPDGSVLGESSGDILFCNMSSK